MAASNVSNTVVTRYANALLDLADESKKTDTILKNLNDLSAMLDSADDFKRLIASPLISAEEQSAAMMAIATKAKLDKLTKNFLGVLIENGRLAALPQVIKSYKREHESRQGQMSATVKVAQKMSAAQEKDLQKALSKMAGSDVVLDIQIDPEILGGMVVTMGSYMIDNSVSRKLVRLKNAMAAGTSDAANQNPKNENLSEVS